MDPVGVGVGCVVLRLHAPWWQLGRAVVAVISCDPACDVGGGACGSWSGVPAGSAGNTKCFLVCPGRWLFLVGPTHPSSLVGLRGKPRLAPFLSPGTGCCGYGCNSRRCPLLCPLREPIALSLAWWPWVICFTQPGSLCALRLSNLPGARLRHWLFPVSDFQ